MTADVTAQDATTTEAGEELPASATFKGETFALNDEISDWAVFEFAEAVDSGADASEIRGMAALLRFVIECIAPADRDRFRSVARRARATAEDLFAFLKGETEDVAEVPIGRPTDSSDGPTAIEPKSEVSSVAKVSRLAGRPDLAAVVEMAQRRVAS